MLAVGGAIAVSAAYVASLWYLLRRERWATVWALALLCSVALSVRLVHWRDYPPGMQEDEPKTLGCVPSAGITPALLFGETCCGNPMLLTALFQGPLKPWVPARWAIRGYALVTNVLAVPAGFAAARALGLRVAPSLGVAGLLAALPWAIFYGRVHMGEMVFHQMLAVAGLARLVFAGGGLAAALIAALGQSLLMYDYFVGRAFAPMALIAAALAPRGRRLLCLLAFALVLLAWTPHLWFGARNAAGGLIVTLLNREYLVAPLQTLARRTSFALLAFGGPHAYDGNLTVSAGAMHPPIVLALALAGAAIAAAHRRRVLLFLVGGFLLGIGPVLLAVSPGASAHRLLMAYPFVSLAVGVALDRRSTWVRRSLTAVSITAAAAQSAQWYFSDVMWPPASRRTFDAARTAVMEALPTGPPAGRLIVDPDIGYWKALGANLDRSEPLSVENWLPANGVESLYAFGPESGALAPFYRAVLGPGRIDVHAGAFIVRHEATDWTWLRRHGWTHSLRCGTEVRAGQVPALWHIGLTFRGVHCRELMTLTWRGRWTGPETSLRLRANGGAEVITPRAALHAAGEQVPIDFSVAPGDSVAVTLRTEPNARVIATLVAVDAGGEQVPAWTHVTPDGGDVAADADDRQAKTD